MKFVKSFALLCLVVYLEALPTDDGYIKQPDNSGEPDSANRLPNMRSDFIARPSCPSGFVYSADGFPKCYAVLNDRVSWDEAQRKCRQRHRSATLAIIGSVLENQIVDEAIRHSDCYHFWLGGQRIVVNDCRSPIVWKNPDTGYIPMVYTNWGPPNPSCSGGTESCLEIQKYRSEWRWNDIICSNAGCPVCEVVKYAHV